MNKCLKPFYNNKSGVYEIPVAENTATVRVAVTRLLNNGYDIQYINGWGEKVPKAQCEIIVVYPVY